MVVRLNDLGDLCAQYPSLREDCCEAKDGYLTEDWAALAATQFSALLKKLLACQAGLCRQLGRACILTRKLQMGSVLNLFTTEAADPPSPDKKKKKTVEVLKNQEHLTAILEHANTYARDIKRGLTSEEGECDAFTYKRILSHVYDGCVEAYIQRVMLLLLG